MARINILVVLFCQILILPIMGGRSEDENPFMDLASALLQNMGGSDGTHNSNGDGLAAIGSLVGTLMQGDNAKNLGALFGQNGGGDAGDVLSGLGSLLGNQNGRIDPSLIGTMISMFSQQMGDTNDEPRPPQSQQAINREKRQSKPDNNINLEGILNVASSFLQNKNAANILPLLVNTISAFSGNEAQKRAHNHEEHATFLPPFVEKLHLYWDLFINSELGKTLWHKSGLQKVMKSFTGPDGSISFELMMKNFENHAFRRHWIKAAAKYLTDTLMHVSKPEVYQKYIVSGQFLINGFLDSQGLPKSTHFNVKKPDASITALIHHVLKKYLDTDTDISVYVKQAIDYLKQIVKLAHATSQSFANRGEYNALADRMTDTLNLEVIEPILRVYRAYKHSVNNPQCQEHLMCLVNRHHDGDKQGLPGFKAGLTKFSSLAASAALSFQNGKGFWDLYNAIQNDVNCQAKYPADCSTFHEHELKVTTEVYHSEL